jgi:large subunit ribosomal protein L5
MEKNHMTNIRIEKISLSIGGTGDYLEKGFKLLKFLSGKTPVKTKSKKRIPSLGVRPGLEIGVVVTIRKRAEEILKRMLMAVDNQVMEKQVSENTFSFGIKEYLEIPGVEYQRDVGIMGLDVTVTFKKSGRRVKLRKIKRGRVPKRQRASKEEIIKFMGEKFQTTFI